MPFGVFLGVDIWSHIYWGCPLLFLLTAHSGPQPSVIVMGYLIESVFMNQTESRRNGSVLEIVAERGCGEEVRGLWVHTALGDSGGLGGETQPLCFYLSAMSSSFHQPNGVK